jgi:hypothetical protein
VGRLPVCLQPRCLERRRESSMLWDWSSSSQSSTPSSHARQPLYDRRPRVASHDRLGGTARRVPQIKRWSATIDARPAVARACSGKDHDFKTANDEGTKRAVFPSYYPVAVWEAT